MGGCCCCSSRGAELSRAPVYYYYPRASEERVPLSSRHVASSIRSSGLLVDTNLDTSVPDAYRPPPAPMPFDAFVGHPQTRQAAQETCDNKNDRTLQTAYSGSYQEVAGGNSDEISPKYDDLKESECKPQSKLELDSAKGQEVEITKSIESIVSAKEECPTCLEEYDAENPKVTTKCEHHFHLACILEWMERSDTCPVCDKEMIIDSPIA